MTPNLVGKTIGGYKLVEEIGEGGLATVYKAYQPTLKRWVAVKVLHYKDKNAVIRFQREAQAIARLRHRNILIVYEYGEEGPWPYIVMEYIEGGTLEDRLTGRPIDWVKTLDLMIPIAEVLAYAHEHGIIHRDVKPSNILMPQEDWPLLADFGLVKLPNEKEEGEVTSSGVTMGTPAYVAPEQARGTVIDHRADIYSLGVVLFEMITGRLPFGYLNPNKVLLAHITEPAPSPRKFNPNCPPELEKIILKTMAKSPDDRYLTMKDMIRDLKNVLDSADGRSADFHQASPASFQTKIMQSSDIPKPLDQKQEARIHLKEKNVTIPIPDDDSVVIGRTHRNTVADIDLGPYGAAQAGVSRHHCLLIRQANQWLLDDLGSLNGTYVNDVRIEPGNPVLLKNGDIIRCSHLSFVFLTKPPPQ